MPYIYINNNYTTCVVMQPTYLPWAGYFNLLLNSDTFVFLDDVQFERRSWQQRNRFLVNGKEHLLTIPVKKASQNSLLKSIIVDDDSSWRQKHINLLKRSYSKTSTGKEILELIEPIILNSTNQFLIDINIKIIKAILRKWNIEKIIIKASDLTFIEKRSSYLYGICELLDCDEYLSPLGSKEYLESDGLFKNSKIKLSYQNYSPNPYLQKNCNEFISHLSIFDVISHLGWNDSLKYCLGDY